MKTKSDLTPAELEQLTAAELKAKNARERALDIRGFYLSGFYSHDSRLAMLLEEAIAKKAEAALEELRVKLGLGFSRS